LELVKKEREEKRENARPKWNSLAISRFKRRTDAKVGT